MKRKNFAIVFVTGIAVLIILLFESRWIVFAPNTKEFNVRNIGRKVDKVNSKQDLDLYDHLANVNISDRLRQYHRRVKKDGQCVEVAKNPVSWWRSQNKSTTHFSADNDYQRMVKASKCGGFMIPEFLKTPLKRDLYPFETRYFADEPCEDHLNASNETFSSLKLLNQSKEYRVGDTIVFQIDMRDGRGNPRTKGGDVIRVWLKDTKLDDTSVAAKVIDLENGTYLAVAVLPWAGTVGIIAALVYPREYIRALLYVHHSIKFLGGLSGKFKNSRASETTPCFTHPILPGFTVQEVCNLTLPNGSPWYCGRPLKRNLSCSDYVSIRKLPSHEIPKYLPLTDAEMSILKYRPEPKSRFRRIPHKLVIIVKPGVGGQTHLTSPAIPCHKINPKVTWNQKYPTGFLFKLRWIFFLCSPTPLTNECLRDKRLFLLGDSNNRAHYFFLVNFTKCHEVLKATTMPFHAPLLCIHNGMNFSLQWNPHSQPFSSNSRVKDLISSAHIMDNITNDGRQSWIVLNHYLHLTTYHLSSWELKLRSLKEGIERLIARNTNVRIVLQGPHIIWDGGSPHYGKGDNLGLFLMEIQREVFKDLQNKVLFVSPWDLTIASESIPRHPRKQIAHQITTMISGYLCNRQ